MGKISSKTLEKVRKSVDFSSIFAPFSRQNHLFSADFALVTPKTIQNLNLTF
jgi:hypothetical protein